ncbi:MAG: DNA replication/repair protein RecF [Flavobacteriaceae bacterium]
MHLKRLSLTNYKNQKAFQEDFEAPINVFIGDNGVGKTNILDAIYHLALGKSYFNPVATQNIHFEADFFHLEGHFQKKDREEIVVCSFKRGGKKLIKRNGKAYERIAEHIGLVPLVIISPADQDLIAAGSSIRRKFIDGIIGQTDTTYLQTLLNYNRILEQRNALLKYFAANQEFDPTTLGIYDDQLVAFGNPIHQKRRAFMNVFTPIFQKRYAQISNPEEDVHIHHQSLLEGHTLEQLFKNNLAKDRAFQYTAAGPHKDDFLFTLTGHPVKKFGSQGQQKSFLIALKLAQFDYMQTQQGVPPIVLLDDIFDKLDQDRVTKIVHLLSSEAFGQIFISDTHADRTEKALQSSPLAFDIFRLETKKSSTL